MRTITRFILFLLLASPAAADPGPMVLWYDEPAAAWTDALAVGNGRLGAMIFGGVGHERIALNEESVWSGSRIDWNRARASALRTKSTHLQAGSSPGGSASPRIRAR